MQIILEYSLFGGRPFTSERSTESVICVTKPSAHSFRYMQPKFGRVTTSYRWYSLIVGRLPIYLRRIHVTPRYYVLLAPNWTAEMRAALVRCVSNVDRSWRSDRRSDAWVHVSIPNHSATEPLALTVLDEAFSPTTGKEVRQA